MHSAIIRNLLFWKQLNRIKRYTDKSTLWSQMRVHASDYAQRRIFDRRLFLWCVSTKYKKKKKKKKCSFIIVQPTHRVCYLKDSLQAFFMFLQSIVPTHGVTISMTTAGLSSLGQLFLLEQLGERDGIIRNKMRQCWQFWYSILTSYCVRKVIIIFYTCSLKAAILFRRS